MTTVYVVLRFDNSSGGPAVSYVSKHVDETSARSAATNAAGITPGVRYVVVKTITSYIVNTVTEDPSV